MTRFGASLLALVVASACAGEPTIKVTNVQVGRSLNADNSVGAITTTFRPDDTMYASVITDGNGPAKITARWSYAGTVVNETTRDVSYYDQAATEFHIQRPGGFPPGDYKLEILFNGESVETRDLRVAR